MPNAKRSGRPGGTRTPNPLIWNQVPDSSKAMQSKDLQDSAEVAWGVAWGQLKKIDPELAEILRLCRKAPELKAAVLILLRSSLEE